MENWFEEKTMLSVKLLDDVFEYLKDNFEIGDKINYTYIFRRFWCGNYSSQKIIEILEDFGYLTQGELPSSTRTIIKLPS